ncbi:MAG: ribonuclease Z [Candidatus Hydrothermarchaeota archaeon]
MEITFLGTSGSIPTTKRNPPGVAIKVDGEIFLLDCGEGIQKQFLLSKLSYMRIKNIVISHLHGDHFLGLSGLVQTMSFLGREEPVYIYTPKDSAKELKDYLDVGYYTLDFPVNIKGVSNDEIKLEKLKLVFAETDHSVPTVACKIEEYTKRGKFNLDKANKLGLKPGPEFSRLERGEKITVGGKVISLEDVVGPSRKGKSIVYSSDTRPCRNVVRLASECDVLIHDSTFSHELKERALETFHSTARDSGEVALESKAKKLVLTHISPRYDGKELLEESKEVFKNTLLAQDLMKLKV